MFELLKVRRELKRTFSRLFSLKKNCSKRPKPKIKYPWLCLFLNENLKVYSNLVSLPCLLETSCILQTAYSNLKHPYTWWNSFNISAFTYSSYFTAWDANPKESSITRFYKSCCLRQGLQEDQELNLRCLFLIPCNTCFPIAKARTVSFSNTCTVHVLPLESNPVVFFHIKIIIIIINKYVPLWKLSPKIIYN